MLSNSWGKSISNIEFYIHPTENEERDRVKTCSAMQDFKNIYTYIPYTVFWTGLREEPLECVKVVYLLTQWDWDDTWKVHTENRFARNKNEYRKTM